MLLSELKSSKYPHSACPVKGPRRSVEPPAGQGSPAPAQQPLLPAGAELGRPGPRGGAAARCTAPAPGLARPRRPEPPPPARPARCRRRCHGNGAARRRRPGEAAAAPDADAEARAGGGEGVAAGGGQASPAVGRFPRRDEGARPSQLSPPQGLRVAASARERPCPSLYVCSALFSPVPPPNRAAPRAQVAAGGSVLLPRPAASPQRCCQTEPSRTERNKTQQAGCFDRPAGLFLVEKP